MMNLADLANFHKDEAKSNLFIAVETNGPFKVGGILRKMLPERRHIAP